MSLYMPLDSCRNISVHYEVGGLPVCYREGNVSGPFVQTVLNALSSLPLPVLQMLAQRRFILVLSDFISTVHPELKFQKPRGHSQHQKYDDLNGICCPDERHIHITELTRRSRPTNTIATLRHELGHAVDYCLGRHLGLGNRDVSSTYEFNRLHGADVARIPYDDQARLRYYIQNRCLAGRAESFAEAVASVLGGGCEDAAYFRQHFPQVVAWVEQQLFDGYALTMPFAV